MLISIVVGYLRHDRKKPAADGGEIEGKNVCEEAAENAVENTCEIAGGDHTAE